MKDSRRDAAARKVGHSSSSSTSAIAVTLMLGKRWGCLPNLADRSIHAASLFHRASSSLLLMRGERGEDLSLLALRYFGEVTAASQLGRHLVEFFWRNLEVTMRRLQAQMCFARLGCRLFEPTARDLADP